MSKAKKNKAVVESTPELSNEIASVETTVETPVEEKVAIYVGKIRDCDKLNVREEPTMNAKVLCKLDKGAEVQIDKTGSTREFYKICTSSGVIGYCMKKYMTIKKQEA